MKKLFIALLFMPTLAVANPNYDPDALCTQEMTIVIYDEDGKAMDELKHARNWPITCVDSVQWRYELLEKLVTDEETRFKALINP
jgi:hypothetical protein